MFDRVVDGDGVVEAFALEHVEHGGKGFLGDDGSFGGKSRHHSWFYVVALAIQHVAANLNRPAL